MKTKLQIPLVLLGFAFSSPAQITQMNSTLPGASVSVSNPPPPAPYSVTQRAPHYKVWEQQVYEQSDSGQGQVVSRTRRVVEMATGLEYSSNGVWMDSQEIISPLQSGGAAATNGQAQVFLPSDLYHGVIQTVTADGQQLNSRPLGLVLADSSNSVMIAELTNSIGQILPSRNKVVYTNAFAGLQADIICTYRKSGFEQDVLLLQQPPNCSAYGINPASARLELWTEFIDSPEPVQKVDATTVQGDLQDTVLRFGDMRMARGKAFLVGSLTNKQEIHVFKSWVHASGRTFLVEAVPLQRIQTQLQSLHASANTVPPGNSHKGAFAKAPEKFRLPPLRHARRSPRPMQVAMADSSSKPGLILDYVTLNGYYGQNSTPMVFQSDTTYFISGPVYCFNVVFEGGTVIKYPNNTTAFIEIQTDPVFVNTARPYRMAVFTAGDDDTVGESLRGAWSGYTGTIQTQQGSGGYANPALRCDDPVPLHNLRIAYAQEAISAWNGANIAISDSQIINCVNGISLFEGANSDYTGFGGPGANLTNCLIASPIADYYDGYWWFGNALAGGGNNATFNLYNCTIDSIGQLVVQGDDGSAPGNFYADSSIFSEMSEFPNSGVSGNYNGFYSTPSTFGNAIVAGSYPFQKVGGGSYYLLGNTSPSFQGAAQTSYESDPNATTQPPIDYSGQTFSQSTTLGPQAPTGDTDLGYHYEKLDYLLSNSQANANLTFSSGTVVAWTGQGLNLASGKQLTFAGSAQSPCYFVRGNTAWEFDSTGPGIGISGVTNASAPLINAAFTHFSALNNQDAFFPANALAVNATDCEFWDGSLGGNVYGTLALNCFNCLFDRSLLHFTTTVSSPACSLSLTNCTQHGGQNVIGRLNSAWPISIVNCASDTAYNCLSGNYGTTDVWADYNATNTWGWFLPAGQHDLLVTNFNWQKSWLGQFYLPPGSTLIDHGSTNANLLGFYHFTTQTNQAKEANTIIDIGYHYVAVDANGNPISTGGDGVPDYVWDANGDGIFDVGDLGNWQVYNSPEPVFSGIGMVVFTPLK